MPGKVCIFRPIAARNTTMTEQVDLTHIKRDYSCYVSDFSNAIDSVRPRVTALDMEAARDALCAAIDAMPESATREEAHVINGNAHVAMQACVKLHKDLRAPRS
jgi:hypothetical protein